MLFRLKKYEQDHSMEKSNAWDSFVLQTRSFQIVVGLDVVSIGLWPKRCLNLSNTQDSSIQQSRSQSFCINRKLTYFLHYTFYINLISCIQCKALLHDGKVNAIMTYFSCEHKLDSFAEPHDWRWVNSTAPTAPSSNERMTETIIVCNMYKRQCYTSDRCTCRYIYIYTNCCSDEKCMWLYSSYTWCMELSGTHALLIWFYFNYVIWRKFLYHSCSLLR